MLKMVRKVVDIRTAMGAGSSDGKIYDLKEAWINPQQMMALERDEKAEQNVKLGLFLAQLGLHNEQFSRIVFSNGETVVVLGAPGALLKELNGPSLLNEVNHVL